MTNSEMLAEVENEHLIEGRPEKVSVFFLDDHVSHILRHRKVLENPEYRVQEDIVKDTMAHIQEHIDALRESGEGKTDRSLLKMALDNALGMKTWQFTRIKAVFKQFHI